VLAFASLAVAGVLLALSGDGPPGPAEWIGLGAALVIAAVGVVLVTRGRSTRTLMRLVMAGALVDVVMLALSGQAMVA
jgi:hypothetical protein